MHGATITIIKELNENEGYQRTANHRCGISNWLILCSVRLPGKGKTAQLFLCTPRWHTERGKVQLYSLLTLAAERVSGQIQAIYCDNTRAYISQHSTAAVAYKIFRNLKFEQNFISFIVTAIIISTMCLYCQQFHHAAL
jgi:hypothetical protein